MSKFNGVIVYEIHPNGCLNGVYTNDHTDTKNEIFNEIARKKPTEEVNNVVEGIYTCCYIDLYSEAFICDLEIKNKNGQYEFEWYGKKNQIKFKGKGWKTRENQITVWYWEV